jgi:AcrR family transcriptional regulator
MDERDEREQAREARLQAKDEAREARGQLREARLEAKDQAREARRQASSAAREQRAHAREKRELARERRIAGHVSRDKERPEGQQPPQRARGLTREDIVDAAVAVADAEGTEAVSMRRIARELGVGAMSLYWHVSSKEELQILMVAAVQADLPEPAGDWRADVATFARTARAALIRHPWAIDYLVSGPPAGPRDARNTERLMAALGGLGLDTKTMAWAGMAIATYVAGAVVREIQEIRWHQDMMALRAEMSDEDASHALEEFVNRLGDPAGYPFMTRLMAEEIDPDSPETRDERFEFGLDCLLDGIAARFQPRQGD